MYIPYRKAYLTGMNPLSFVTFFTVGELGMMGAIAVGDRGGVTPLVAELVRARDVLFWLLCGGFVWVVGDLFQQYAAKYVGISRGIPLSNTNQLWGLAWGVLVFGELQGAGTALPQVVGGSLLMAAGAAAIAFATATADEHVRWQDAARREGARYGIDPGYTRAALAGEASGGPGRRRGWLDWGIMLAATAVFVGFAMVARVPELAVNGGPLMVLVVASLALLGGTGWALWKVTGFN